MSPIDGIWEGDACSLVDAFRAGTITPPEALEMSLLAIEHSQLNAFCHIDLEGAHRAASGADVDLPFGGVPIGVKELDQVKGWPVLRGVASCSRTGWASTSPRWSSVCRTQVPFSWGRPQRGIRRGQLHPHPATRHDLQPMEHRAHAGGSWAGPAAVSGGLVTLGTAGDGGGSIRIPAGFTGMFGLKATFGRIPRGPHTMHPPLTVTVGCVSRSVRDTARWFDVCNGHDPREHALASTGLRMGRGDSVTCGASLQKARVIRSDLGHAVVSSRVAAAVVGAAEALIAEAGMKHVEVAISLPEASLAWVMSEPRNPHGRSRRPLPGMRGAAHARKSSSP